MRLTVRAVAVVRAGEAHRPAWITPGQARRIDPLAALAVAAVDRVGRPTEASTAVVVGTAWGTVTATRRVADDLRTHGDAGSSPAAFIASVHHHPAGTLGELLGLHGPVGTISLGACSGLGAIRTACLHLHEGRCTEALVVAADLPDAFWAEAAAAAVRYPTRPTGGAVALRLALTGPGRPMTLRPWTPADPLPAPQDAWWPTSALALAPWAYPGAFTVVEVDGDCGLVASVGPGG